MTLPKISIVTPSYNCEKTIQKTIESVISLSYSNIEYIIIDGNSIDNTLFIIKKYVQQYPEKIIYISENDKGIYDAMNKGTRLATGEWILYLGGDDYIINPNIFNDIFQNLIYSNYDLIYGNVKYEIGTIGGGRYTRSRLIGTNIPHQAIIYRRIKVIELGGYNLRYKIMADKLLNLQIFSEDLSRIKYCDLIISYFSNSGISSNYYDYNFIADVDKIVLKYYAQHFTKKEIYTFIMYYSFLNIKYHKLFKGLIWIYKSGKILNNLRNIIYCILFRFHLKKE